MWGKITENHSEFPSKKHLIIPSSESTNSFEGNQKSLVDCLGTDQQSRNQ